MSGGRLFLEPLSEEAAVDGCMRVGSQEEEYLKSWGRDNRQLA